MRIKPQIQYLSNSTCVRFQFPVNIKREEMKVKVDGFSGGDRVHTKLPKSQTDLLKKLKATGKPIVLVLLNGSALSINWENDNIPAIIEAWYPGQAGGTAIADVIFGDYNPAGRLPVTFYKDINDIPPFSDYKMKGKTYRYFEGTPLYEFGYGLSFTDFEYSNLTVSEEVKAGEDLEVKVDIKNIGKMDGEEVAQVYLKNPDAGALNPKISLSSFERVFLKAGEQKTVTFMVSKDQMSMVNDNGEKVVNPGALNLYVGGSQPSKSSKKGSVVTKTVKVVGNVTKV